MVISILKITPKKTKIKWLPLQIARISKDLYSVGTLDIIERYLIILLFRSLECQSLGENSETNIEKNYSSKNGSFERLRNLNQANENDLNLMSHSCYDSVAIINISIWLLNILQIMVCQNITRKFSKITSSKIIDWLPSSFTSLTLKGLFILLGIFHRFKIQKLIFKDNNFAYSQIILGVLFSLYLFLSFTKTEYTMKNQNKIRK